MIDRNKIAFANIVKLLGDYNQSWNLCHLYSQFDLSHEWNVKPVNRLDADVTTTLASCLSMTGTLTITDKTLCIKWYFQFHCLHPLMSEFYMFKINEMWFLLWFLNYEYMQQLTSAELTFFDNNHQQDNTRLRNLFQHCAVHR